MKKETNLDRENISKKAPFPKQIQTWEWEGGSTAFGSARSAYFSSFVPSLLTRDYELMDEAARRLLDGTCCLMDEEKVAAFELFNKLKTALMDHIHFEEDTVFKSLNLDVPGTKEFIHAMKAEHRELVTLIDECMRELQESHGVAFRLILTEFLASFQRHRLLEIPFWYKQDTRAYLDESLERMRLRADDGLL